MWFLVAGVVLLALKALEVMPVAQWPWWWVLAPFAAAALWWTWADASGYTKRKAVERDNRRIAARRERHREQLGLLQRRRK